MIVCFSYMCLSWVNKHPILSLHLFDDIRLNVTLNYQISSLFIAFGIIYLTLIISGKEYIHLLNLTKINGKVGVEPWIGITSENKMTWKELGRNFAVIISSVTIVVICFQVYGKNDFNLIVFPNLLMVFVFAILNSFIEESVFGLSCARVFLST